MNDRVTPSGHGNIDQLILQALVRRLLAKNLLSQDDLRDILFDAATRLDVLGTEQTPQVARVMVEEDLLPLFLDKPKL